MHKSPSMLVQSLLVIGAAREADQFDLPCAADFFILVLLCLHAKPATGSGQSASTNLIWTSSRCFTGGRISETQIRVHLLPPLIPAAWSYLSNTGGWQTWQQEPVMLQVNGTKGAVQKERVYWNNWRAVEWTHLPGASPTKHAQDAQPWMVRITWADPVFQEFMFSWVPTFDVQPNNPGRSSEIQIIRVNRGSIESVSSTEAQEPIASATVVLLLLELLLAQSENSCLQGKALAGRSALHAWAMDKGAWWSTQVLNPGKSVSKSWLFSGMSYTPSLNFLSLDSSFIKQG